MPGYCHGDSKIDMTAMSGQYGGNNWPTGYPDASMNYYGRQQPVQYGNQWDFYEDYPRYSQPINQTNDYRQQPRPPIPSHNQRHPNYSNYSYPHSSQQMPYDDRRYPPPY